MANRIRRVRYHPLRLARAFFLLDLCLALASAHPAQASGLAGAQWPEIMNHLPVSTSFSLTAAPLPPHLTIVPPGPDVPAEWARFSGKWAGWACWRQGLRNCDVRLAVLEIKGNQAGVVSTFGAGKEYPAYVGRPKATFVGKELILEPADGRKIHFRFRPDGALMYVNYPASSVGDDGLLGVLTQEPEPPLPIVSDVDWQWIMDRAEYGPPQTRVKAPLPANVEIIAPGSDTPPDRGRFSGRWAGAACRNDGRLTCDTRLAVTKIDGETASVIHTWGSTRVDPPIVQHREARFFGRELQVELDGGRLAIYRFRSDGNLQLIIFPGASMPHTRMWSGVLIREQ